MQNKPSCPVARFGTHLGMVEQALRGLHDGLVEVQRNIESGLIAVILQRLAKLNPGLALPSEPQ